LWWVYFDTVDGSEIRALRKKNKLEYTLLGCIYIFH
jgi:hypothetical protein